MGHFPREGEPLSDFINFTHFQIFLLKVFLSVQTNNCPNLLSNSVRKSACYMTSQSMWSTWRGCVGRYWIAVDKICETPFIFLTDAPHTLTHRRRDTRDIKVACLCHSGYVRDICIESNTLAWWEPTSQSVSFCPSIMGERTSPIRTKIPCIRKRYVIII